MLLSAVGIYGMLAYDVSQRTGAIEIGIRAAIETSRGQIVGLILRQGLWKAGIGLVIGLGGAFCVSRYLSSLLYEVKPADQLTFAGVPLILLAVAFAGALVAAARAARSIRSLPLRCGEARISPLLRERGADGMSRARRDRRNSCPGARRWVVENARPSFNSRIPALDRSTKRRAIGPAIASRSAPAQAARR